MTSNVKLHDYLSRWNAASENALLMRLCFGAENGITQRSMAEAKRCRDLYLAMSPRRVVLPAHPWRESPMRAWRRLGPDAGDQVVALRVAA